MKRRLRRATETAMVLRMANSLRCRCPSRIRDCCPMVRPWLASISRPARAGLPTLPPRMIEDLGEAARPYLKSWYNAVRHHPGAVQAGLTLGMDDPDTVDAVFLSLGADERLANDNDTSDEPGLHPEQPIAREAASEEVVEPPALGGEDVGIERSAPQGRPSLVASPASSPPPAPPAEPGYAGGRADGPRPVEPILGSDLGRNWNLFV